MFGQIMQVKKIKSNKKILNELIHRFSNNFIKITIDSRNSS